MVGVKGKARWEEGGSVEGLGKIVGKALRGCPLGLSKGGRVGF
jgi:hypothetical protein